MGFLTLVVVGLAMLVYEPVVKERAELWVGLGLVSRAGVLSIKTNFSYVCSFPCLVIEFMSIRCFL